MVQRVSTVAFEGIEARAVDVQVQVAPGLPAFAIVGSINLDARGTKPVFVVRYGCLSIVPLSGDLPRVGIGD
jgi:hypothetical protein